MRIRRKHAFDLLSAHEDSLTSAANFRIFFEWFRNREDLENEGMKYRNMRQMMLDLSDAEAPPPPQYPDPQLEAVRHAIASFLPDYGQPSVRREPLRMVVRKYNQEYRIDQLSDGEKCLIALIGDLARRLAIANPSRPNPLEGSGVVLIDEIDLHLHPAWQRMIIPRLSQVFPNCQFIVSTHSPQVLGEVEASDIRLLYWDENEGIIHHVPKQARGLDSNGILDELMRPNGDIPTLTRNREIMERLDKLFQVIDEERFPEAKQEIAALKEELHGSIPDLVHAESLIAMLEDDLETEDPEEEGDGE